MKKYNCPSCAAEVAFQSNLSVYAVCKYCNSMIVRRDVDVESIGTMAALPDDMSPLQIGTAGYYDGLRFTIIGRMKIGWDDGVWNEWFLYTDDGRRGWLAEAQGSYGISFETDDVLPEDVSFKLGHYIKLKDQRLRVADRKNATCIGSEGELPFAAPKGRKTLAIDLVGHNGEFASIEILDENSPPRIYVGHYVEWNDMRCQNLRPLEGW